MHPFLQCIKNVHFTAEIDKAFKKDVGQLILSISYNLEILKRP